MLEELQGALKMLSFAFIHSSHFPTSRNEIKKFAVPGLTIYLAKKQSILWNA